MPWQSQRTAEEAQRTTESYGLCGPLRLLRGSLWFLRECFSDSGLPWIRYNQRKISVTPECQTCSLALRKCLSLRPIFLKNGTVSFDPINTPPACQLPAWSEKLLILHCPASDRQLWKTDTWHLNLFHKPHESRKPENHIRNTGDKQQYRYLNCHERHFQSDTAVGNGQTGAMGFCLLTKLKNFFLPYCSFWPRKGRYRHCFKLK